MEDLEPGEEAHAVLQKYAEGELSLLEMGAAIDEMNDRDFGPVHVSRTSVLKNLRNILDPELLERLEARSTVRRLTELSHTPLGGAFDPKHLRAIHR